MTGYKPVMAMTLLLQELVAEKLLVAQETILSWVVMEKINYLVKMAMI